MIFEWPTPVGLKSFPRWERIDPAQESRGWNGQFYGSAHGRSRIHADFSVSARKGNTGAGYMEALKRLLAGVHYVRLYRKPFTPIGGWRDTTAMEWTSGGTDLDWTSGGTSMVWYSGSPAPATLTTSAGLPAIIVTGLPPNTRVIIPGEHVNIGAEQRMAVNEAITDGVGAAVIRLTEAFTAGGIATLGETETGIFKPLRPYPQGGGPIDSDYTYDWQFVQVFADEDTAGTATEITDWWT